MMQLISKVVFIIRMNQIYDKTVHFIDLSPYLLRVYVLTVEL